GSGWAGTSAPRGWARPTARPGRWWSCSCSSTTPRRSCSSAPSSPAPTSCCGARPGATTSRYRSSGARGGPGRRSGRGAASRGSEGGGGHDGDGAAPSSATADTSPSAARSLTRERSRLTRTSMIPTATSGRSYTRSRNGPRERRSSRLGTAAVTVAERGPGFSSAISPNASPLAEDLELARAVADADLALGHHVEAGADLALPHDVGARRHLDLVEERGDVGQDLVRRAAEEAHALEDDHAFQRRQHACLLAACGSQALRGPSRRVRDERIDVARGRVRDVGRGGEPGGTDQVQHARPHPGPEVSALLPGREP